MSFGLSVSFESVVVPTLFLADLAVPSEPLKSLGLHLVGEVFGRSDCETLWGTATMSNETHLKGFTFSSWRSRKG